MSIRDTVYSTLQQNKTKGVAESLGYEQNIDSASFNPQRLPEDKSHIIQTPVTNESKLQS